MSSQRKDETREDYLAREREVSRAKYKAKREAAGLPYERGQRGRRPVPMTDEQRTEREREWQRTSYLRHREEKIARNKKWQKEHREERKAWHKRWAAEHPDLKAAAQLRYRVRHGLVVYGPPRPPRPKLLGVHGPPIPPAIKYANHARDMRARHWIGDAIHEPEVRTTLDVYLVLRDELRDRGMR